MSNNLTVVQLERLLDRKRSKLDRLVKRQEQLQKSLASVDQKIAAIGGKISSVGSRRGVRRRPKNDRPLIEVVVDVLGAHPKGLTLKELAAAVLATGYKTFSDRFENVLYQALYHNMKRLAHNPELHTYTVRKTAAKKSAPKEKSAAKESASNA